MKKTLVLILTLVLTACSRNEQPASTSDGMARGRIQESNVSEAATDAAGAATDAVAPMLMKSRPEPGQPNLPPMTLQAAMIAYSYAMGLELPAKHVIPVRDAHLKACQVAGPTRCQLLGTSSHAIGKDEVTAELSLRGEPKWLEGFRTAVQGDAEKADGRLVTNTIESEDLTRQIVDTEATLRAQTKLRERLTDLLAHHQGKLADLLEVERELARVQGEIDGRTSELNVMRTRISMSDLIVSYASEGVAISDQTADPTVQAFREFLGIVSYSFAGLIRFVAGLLPWMIILGPIGWYIRRWWQQRRAAKALAKPA
jgi:Domain of unknown function (DUF4349)